MSDVIEEYIKDTIHKKMKEVKRQMNKRRKFRNEDWRKLI